MHEQLLELYADEEFEIDDSTDPEARASWWVAHLKAQATETEEI